MKKLTYDEIQLAAKLTICKGCQRPFYFTVKRKKCADCRKARP